MTYKVGFRLENPLSGDAAIFAGYDVNGQEHWCEICLNEDDHNLECLGPPEAKTFLGFNGSWTRWQSSKADFAKDVEKVHQH